MNAPQNSAGVDERLTVMSYNIRYDTSDDGRDAWPNRRDHVVDMIEAHQPDLLGVQEALHHQFEYLEDELSNYAWYGVGRDDGRDTGEFVPLGFRADRFSLQDEGTLWLSERPHEPGSKSWDAYCPRIVSWVSLESKNRRESLIHFNTHFDHQSALARHQSAELLRDRIAETAQSSRVVVTADLNSPESATPYTILAGDDGREREAILQDSRFASRVDKKRADEHIPRVHWNSFRAARLHLRRSFTDSHSPPYDS